MTRTTIVPATTEHIEAYLRAPAALGQLLGSPVPDGWPEFPEAVGHTLDVLRAHPEQAGWWMYFFLDVEGRLVGSGGFAGPPAERTIEVGYEIAPAFRRRGHASAAVRELLAVASRTGEVDRVVAHTLAADERSAGVLRATGFAEAGRVHDDEHGELVRWARAVDAAPALS